MAWSTHGYTVVWSACSVSKSLFCAITLWMCTAERQNVSSIQMQCGIVETGFSASCVSL